MAKHDVGRGAGEYSKSAEKLNRQSRDYSGAKHNELNPESDDDDGYSRKLPKKS